MISARKIQLSGSVFRIGSGIIAVFIVMHMTGCAHRIEQSAVHGSRTGRTGKGEAIKRGVHFTIDAPGAEQVTLVLMSTRASPTLAFKKSAIKQNEGIWIADLDLIPGEYRYFFLVDGAIKVERSRGRVERDDFGGETGVLTVLQDSDGGLNAF